MVSLNDSKKLTMRLKKNRATLNRKVKDEIKI